MKLSYFSYDFSEYCCVAPLVFRAPEGPAAREPSAPHGLPRWAWPLYVGVRGVGASAGPPGARPPPPATATKPIGGASKSHPDPTSLTSSQALAALIPAPTTNFARNSPTTISNFEFRSLELQRFQTLLKLLPIELRASFLEATPCHHPPAPQRGPPPCRSQATQAGKNSPSTRKTPQNQHFFASRANFVTVRSMNHPRQALRPQPKPRVAFAHAPTPVAHWPHD